MTEIADLIPLFSELNDLKRIHSAKDEFSIAQRLFQRAWGALESGDTVRAVALGTTSRALISCRLGAISADVLSSAGLTGDQINGILLESFQTVSGCVDSKLCQQLIQQLSIDLPDSPVPDFVNRLCDEPRAGATSPGRPRIVLHPPESHGDHCLMVAVYSVLLSPCFGASSETPFLAALTHHLHNAWLPDGGFTGEQLVGEHLEKVVACFRSRAAMQIREPLRREMMRALEETATADSAEGKAFHAADVIDRVLQMKWYEQAANFRVATALKEMQLVHAGPIQAFHLDTLREAGLW